MQVPNIELNNNQKIPQVGLGLWQVKDQADFDQTFNHAVKVGYRHFDSAQAYENEQFLGNAWKASGLNRDELFITTKIRWQRFEYDDAITSFEESITKLQTDYVNLLLLHWPTKGTLVDGWRALEKIHSDGRALSIGVSNYTIENLKQMKEYSHIKPAVNQVEQHVFLQQPDLLEYCRSEDIAVEAYSPLAHASAMGNDPSINEIAIKHGRTYAQIMLRWLVQNGLVILPKSITPSRIAENFEVFDFTLDDDDMSQLATLNRNLRTCSDPTNGNLA